MSDSVRPHRWQPTRLPYPWDSPGKNTRVGFHFLPQCMKMKSESEVTQSCLTLRNPWTAAYQAPLSMGFSRQEYWSGGRALISFFRITHCCLSEIMSSGPSPTSHPYLISVVLMQGCISLPETIVHIYLFNVCLAYIFILFTACVVNRFSHV